jgi:RNA-binding protein Nova
MVSNKDAGTIIGRGGATISSIQSKSGARVKVSNSKDYFPGTENRVVAISGGMPQVSQATLAVLHEVFNDSEAGRSGDANIQTSVDLIIPDMSCGLVIGKGGENIKALQDRSGARLQLTPKERQAMGTEERILAVTGTIAQVRNAFSNRICLVCAAASGCTPATGARAQVTLPL